MDAELRAMERAASRGEPEAEASLLARRVRAGELTKDRVELAAYAGHKPSRRLLGWSYQGLVGCQGGDCTRPWSVGFGAVPLGDEDHARGYADAGARGWGWGFLAPDKSERTVPLGLEEFVRGLALRGRAGELPLVVAIIAAAELASRELASRELDRDTSGEEPPCPECKGSGYAEHRGDPANGPIPCGTCGPGERFRLGDGPHWRVLALARSWVHLAQAGDPGADLCRMDWLQLAARTRALGGEDLGWLPFPVPATIDTVGRGLVVRRAATPTLAYCLIMEAVDFIADGSPHRETTGLDGRMAEALVFAAIQRELVAWALHHGAWGVTHRSRSGGLAQLRPSSSSLSQEEETRALASSLEREPRPEPADSSRRSRDRAPPRPSG